VEKRLTRDDMEFLLGYLKLKKKVISYGWKMKMKEIMLKENGFLENKLKKWKKQNSRKAVFFKEKVKVKKKELVSLRISNKIKKKMFEKKHNYKKKGSNFYLGNIVIGKYVPLVRYLGKFNYKAQLSCLLNHLILWRWSLELFEYVKWVRSLKYKEKWRKFLVFEIKYWGK
jgi:hypothetical protein